MIKRHIFTHTHTHLVTVYIVAGPAKKPFSILFTIDNVESLDDDRARLCVGDHVVCVRCAAVPSTPSSLRLTGMQRDAVTLSWDRPEFDGGAPITGYTVERCDATWGSGGVGWTTIGTVSADTHTFRATNLGEGSRYHFRVSAENSVGVGSSASTPHAVEVKSQYGESSQTV